MDENQNRSEKVRKNKVVLEHLERMVDDLVVMFEETYQTKLTGQRGEIFRIKAKGVLTYWLSLIYDEASSEVKNLEIALDTSRVMVKKLRLSEQNLLAISASLSSRPPAGDLLKTGVQQRMEIEKAIKHDIMMLSSSLEESVYSKKTMKIKPIFPDVPELGYKFSQEHLEKTMKENRQQNHITDIEKPFKK